MGWYKTGTVSVTNGSTAVIGTGTAFIANARVGDAYRGPDGEWYEVTNIASNTALSISPNYQGTTVATGSYSLAPMQGYVKDSADALRAATQVIGQAASDASTQVTLATAAATASQNSATAASTSATNSASSATSANSSKVAAKTSEDNAKVSETNASTSKTNAATSATNAGNSATAAANSATQAANSAASVSGKASSGANSDITSLSGLTTPLSLAQGGTGSATQAGARSNLGLGTAAISTVVVDTLDATAGRVLIVGSHGVGGLLPRIESVNIDSLRSSGDYFVQLTSGQGSLPVYDSGYLESHVYASTYAIQMFTTASAGVKYNRSLVAGVWGLWIPSSIPLVDAAILYPNGGTAGAPANVATGTRYTVTNPWGAGVNVWCVAEILVGGNWGTTGWVTGSTSGYGVRADQMDSGSIIVTVGGSGTYAGASYAGGSINVTGNATYTAAVPCRVKAWRIK